MKTPRPHADFEAALRRDAALAREQMVPSDDLASRIAREVHQSRAEAATASATPARSWRVAVLSLLAAGACGAVTMMMLKEPNAPPTPVPSPVVASATAAEGNAAASTSLFTALPPQAIALLAEDPLQTEVDAVVADARSALQFLALNFLPTAPDTLQPGRG